MNRHRLFQYSTRSLSLVTVAIAVLFGIVREGAIRQQHAGTLIQNTGGQFWFDWEVESEEFKNPLWSGEKNQISDHTPWFPRIFNPHFFYTVEAVSCDESQINLLEDLPNLQQVSVVQVTDPQQLIASLRPLPKLEFIAVYVKFDLASDFNSISAMFRSEFPNVELEIGYFGARSDEEWD